MSEKEANSRLTGRPAEDLAPLAPFRVAGSAGLAALADSLES